VTIKTLCAIATFACAMIGMSGDARADFRVLCPTGNFTASWDHTGGFSFSGPFSFDSNKELLVTDTRFLKCFINADFNLTLNYRNPGTCGGTVNMSSTSAVFGRNELFQSGPQPVEGTAIGGSCFFNADVNFMEISLEMSEACESLSSGQGWTCPDTAHQILPEFGGIVEEAPTE
jgi:hypothetical protein